MILGFQILALIFALIMVYFSYLNFRKGNINSIEIIFWFLAWIGAIFIILFPNIINSFSNTLAISRAFDLAVIGGFVLVLPMVYLSYIRTKKIENKLEELVRNEALKGLDSENQKRK